VVTVPLVLLAIPSVVIGFMTIQPMLFGDFFKDVIFVDAAKHPAWPTGRRFPRPVQMALHGLHDAPFWLALAGVAGCRTTCTWSIRLCRQPSRPRAADLHLLENKYYLDWINENIMARGARAWAPAFGRAAIRPSSTAPGQRFLEAGRAGFLAWCAGFSRAYLYHYALVMILGVFVLMTYFVWLNK
jgi:NADH-quinone oxidoreductase subunit L